MVKQDLIQRHSQQELSATIGSVQTSNLGGTKPLHSLNFINSIYYDVLRSIMLADRAYPCEPQLVRLIHLLRERVVLADAVQAKAAASITLKLDRNHICMNEYDPHLEKRLPKMYLRGQTQAQQLPQHKVHQTAS